MIGSEGPSARRSAAEGQNAKDLTYLEVLSDFTDKTLEGKFADEKFRRLLVTTNFTKSDSTGPETMGLLDTTGCGLCKER